MKIALALLFSVLSLYASLTTINKNIVKTSHEIKAVKTRYSSIYSKMSQNAKDIFKQTQLIGQQQKKLRLLTQELNSKQAAYTQNKTKLQTLQTTQQTLQNNQKKIEQKLIFAIAKLASLTTLVNMKNQPSADAMMSDAIVKSLIKITNEKVNDLNNKFYQNSKVIDTTQQKISVLQNDINAIDKKKQELKQTKHENELALAKLQKDKQKYKQALEKILRQQRSLQATLEHLKIIKVNKIEEARRQKKEQAILNQPTNVKLLNVKKVGSSYKAVQTIRYRGPKTIAPLKSYTVSKRYGPYVDPVYKIKIFNESVSLQSKTPNAKVRTVFNGKIIFAKETPLLKKVVIMENANGMHTIYANLSQLAPDIRVGKKLKKSSVIGRVNHQLVFEVTQKRYHINPVELFRY
jgi:septal ring factor EnvC (AmiA/AmiB activator)